MLAHTTRALQLLFRTIADVDTLDELARVGTVAVELYEADDAVLRELMDAIEARATTIREQLRLFPCQHHHRAAIRGLRCNTAAGDAPTNTDMWRSSTS